MGIEVVESTNVDTEVEAEVEVDEVTEVTEEVNSGAEEVIGDKVVKEIMIPKERFDEVNNKYKELFGEFEKLKEQIEETQVNQEAEATGTSTAVEEVNSKLAKQESKYNALLDTMYSDKLKTVPEEFREVIPEGLTTEEKLSWIGKAEEKGLFGKKKVDVVVGQPLNHSAEQSAVEAQKRMNPIQLFASYYGTKSK